MLKFKLILPPSSKRKRSDQRHLKNSNKSQRRQLRLRRSLPQVRQRVKSLGRSVVAAKDSKHRRRRRVEVSPLLVSHLWCRLPPSPMTLKERTPFLHLRHPVQWSLIL